ncbi:MAG: DUF1553 domain-containing protein [Planctomycetota bacterium]
MANLRSFVLVLFTSLVICSFGVDPPTSFAQERVDFEKEIAPVLQQHCLRCHSPGIDKGDVSLATLSDLEEGGYIEAGDAESSYLIELVSGTSTEPPRMPKDGPPLSNAEIKKIKRWIDEGANWPTDFVIREKSKADTGFWSFQPLKVDHPNPTIDGFIESALSAQELSMRQISDRRTLIRRASYDLIGLPPTPAEIEDFLADPDSDEVAFANLVDRLLESPHYGERWGRHWLDVVRFGESNGFERNVLINSLWPFRDYVIESINADKPFDQLIREHLAGDVTDSNDPSMMVGSAFLVSGPYDDVGNQDAAQAAQIRANTLDEMINATGQAFLGMTLGCARCHDHKFDPIKQEDYYAFYATFAGVRHGEVLLETSESKKQRTQKLKPLNEQLASLETEQRKIQADVVARAREPEKLDQWRARWTRPPVDRTGTEEVFKPVRAKFVRLTCEAQDSNVATPRGFRIDEFEIYSSQSPNQNVALASNGSVASGPARKIDDFPNAYGPHLAIDGKTGERFISSGNVLTIELAKPTPISRILFSSAKGETTPEHSKFVFVADYRIEASLDGETWTEIAHGRDRKPVNETSHLNRRLEKLEMTQTEKKQLVELRRSIQKVKAEIAKTPPPAKVWIGTRSQKDAKGPFHVFIGGSPQRTGVTVVPASMSAVTANGGPTFELNESSEAERRIALANWVTDAGNPLTPRVLANRLWHYHFGTGIVDTPSDFGYMGGRPTHPELLDFLATKLIENKWQLKPMHRMIMNTKAYRQASDFDQASTQIDARSRLLWRFPPRRLSAEEIRDTMLVTAGKLDKRRGGPGFRLYDYWQDNVSTYVPLDRHGPETFRRAVYHQNARASVVDLMTEFDQPDCAFSTPRRAQTTTPLQALTMFNHSFTLDMANALASRLQSTSDEAKDQIELAYELCYGRPADAMEVQWCQTLVQEHGLEHLCRVLFNTSEMIYVK